MLSLYFLALVPLLINTSSAAPKKRSLCATCPPTDLGGNPLVAGSGGTLGVPRFCGYSPNAPSAGPQVICFYSNSGVVFENSNDLCPPITSLVTCQWQ